MLRALETLIDQMNQENITRGVQRSIHEMAFAITQSTWYTPAQAEFAKQVYQSSGRAYKGFIPKMKLLLSDFKASHK